MTSKSPASSPADTRLEHHFDVRAAAIELGLNINPNNPEDKTGERWLRDGFNRPEDGSKGRRFPGFYMSGKLMFSESDLIAITQIAREESEARTKAQERMPGSTGRPRHLRNAPTR
ncbi:hypothetical protein [Streptomyces sp. NPDC001091]